MDMKHLYMIMSLNKIEKEQLLEALVCCNIEGKLIELAKSIVEYNRKIMYPFTTYADYEKYGDLFQKFEPKQEYPLMIINNDKH